MLGKFVDQVVLITGAGRGIGRAMAERFAAEGAIVAIVARSESQLIDCADAIGKAGGRAAYFIADVTDETAVNEAVAKVEAQLGAINLLINNAGSFSAIGPSWEVDLEKWWRDIRTNLMGSFLCARAVVRRMVPRRRGRIINLLGGGTNISFPYGSGYGTSKAALTRLTECLGDELREHGIYVFGLLPGLVRTAMADFQTKTEEGKKWLPGVQQELDEGKDFPPAVAAEYAVQLASGRFDALTGKAFNVKQNLDEIESRIPQILEKGLMRLKVVL